MTVTTRLIDLTDELIDLRVLEFYTFDAARPVWVQVMAWNWANYRLATIRANRAYVAQVAAYLSGHGYDHDWPDTVTAQLAAWREELAREAAAA